MKKTIFLYFILISFKLFSQNLVTNPGFEQYTTCPDNFDELSLSQGWSSYRETPDYYNNCAIYSYISPPNCYFGFQYPHLGNAFAGFYTFNPIADNREFIGVQLTSILSVGQKYFISFYVNLGGKNLCTIASNNIGVKFSTIPYSYTNPAPINNTAHLYSNDIISDTMKWTKISGSYIADSTFLYLIIGNFFNDVNTDTIHLSTNNGDAYYFIDDVCVTTDSLFNENWTGITEQVENKKELVTIYPNPCTTELNVQFNNMLNEQTTISILDITGKVVMQAVTNNKEYLFNVEKLPKGLYLVKMEVGGRVLLRKITKV